MALQVACDNPECEEAQSMVSVDSNIPVGWWELSQETGGEPDDVAFVFHDIGCVLAWARMHVLAFAPAASGEPSE